MYLYFHFLVKISHGKDTYLWDRSGGEWVPLSRVNAHPDDGGGGGGVPLSRVNAHLDDDDDDDDDDDVDDDDDD